MGYKSRFENYQIFKQSLGVPLVTVELSFGGNFQLSDQDSDVLIQINSGDIMFQKERLLNIALEHIPNSIPYVAWIDCDLCLERNWWQKTASKLNKHAMVQLFSKFYDLPPNTLPNDFNIDGLEAHPPTAKVLARGVSAAEACTLQSGRAIVGGHLFGVAWAGHTEIMKHHGFYDACILGGGDRAVGCAALGQFEQARDIILMNDQRWNHYCAWARKFHAQIKNNIGFVDATVYHLWHGDIVNRQYTTRHQEFAKFNFDPTTDIAVSEEGAWRWNNDKSEMHAFVKNFFKKRSEDQED